MVCSSHGYYCLLSHDFKCGTDDLFNTGNDVHGFNSMDDVMSIVSASNRNLLPKISKVTRCGSGTIVEFEIKNSDVHTDEVSIRWFPLLWFKFSPIVGIRSNDGDNRIQPGIDAEAAAFNQPQNEAPGNSPVVYAETQQDDNQEDHKILNIRLHSDRAANMIAVKLIGQENRMEEMSDLHSWPNIDMTSINAKGRIVLLPENTMINLKM